jgi:hypothetical protein
VEDRGRPQRLWDRPRRGHLPGTAGRLPALDRATGPQLRAFCQTIAAEDDHGKRIRFSAALKANNVTDGWGGLWLRVDGPRLDEMLAIDTMEDRPLVGTTGWQQHALVLDVAAAATISFGAGLSGEGELPVSKLAFEEVGSEVPVTAGPHRPRHPQNLDFSQA